MIICISNWEKYNPRKRGDTKSSTWFRCQNNFLTDPDFYDYTSDQKMVWLCLLAECSAKMSATIKINPSLIASILRVRPSLVLATIEGFEKSGFISQVAHTQRTRIELAADSPQSSGATYLPTYIHTDSESTSVDPPPTSKLRDKGADLKFGQIDLLKQWHEHSGSLAKPRSLTSKRRDKVASRISEEPDPEYWVGVIKRLAASSFATGKNDRHWKADFDWLTANDTNHVKVAEGKYDDRRANASSDYTVLSEKDLDEL